MTEAGSTPKAAPDISIAGHAKKRIEMIIEAPALAQVTRLLDELDLGGYTVTPAEAGRGRHGSWRRDGLVGEAGRMVVVICILDAARLDEVLRPLFQVVSRQVGIVSVSDVMVVRSDHF